MRYLVILVLLAACGREVPAPIEKPAVEPAKPTPLVFVCPAEAVMECQFIVCKCWDSVAHKYVAGEWVPKN